jgi:hypothetical protein
MKPGTTPDQYQKQIIQGRVTLQRPTHTKTTSTTTTTSTHQNLVSSSHTANKAFTHSQIIDLDLPYLICNRTQQFYLLVLWQ